MDPGELGRQDFLEESEKKRKPNGFPFSGDPIGCATWGSQPRRKYRSSEPRGSFPAGADCVDTEDS